jgi:hypothetical protein
MIQWRADEAAVLENRGQAPLNSPILKQVIKWLTGTERRTRIDWDVLPRQEADVDIANIKKQVLKWVSDVNGSAWERSHQFEDQVIVGIGWIEDCVNNDRREEAITNRHQDWKEMWWDPYSRSNTLRDCRYIIRAKFLDLDYAIAMMPDRADELTRHACDTLDSSMELQSLEVALPMMFYGLRDMPTRSVGASGQFGAQMIVRRPRKRVLVLETWFKKAVNTPLLMGDGADDAADALDGKKFDPANTEHQQALADGVVTLVDGVTEEIWVALWTPGALLRINRSPYKHNKYPFTPAWASRRHRDGMPYGIPRETRDSVDELNKRKSKILFDLSTQQVMYEVDAMDEADEANNLDELRRPDGEVRLATGGIGKVKVDRGSDRVAPQIQMLDRAKEEIYEASGVTRENTGTSTGEQSGRAILAKQQQGAVVTAVLFDNYRQAIQESGQKQLSNCEQFMTTPQLIRLVGPKGAFEWASINQPSFDPTTGQVIWNNDITKSEADFVVDETDFRETVRMAMSEMMFELIGRLPPNLAMSLLDVAVEMTDLPNKTQIANRIRSITGMQPAGQENSQEAQAQQQAQQQAQSQQQQAQAAAQAAQQAALDSKTRLNNAQAGAAAARANLDNTKAQHQAVLGKAEAMNTAGMVHAAPALAPAADKIWDPSQQFPMPPNQFTTAQ